LSGYAEWPQVADAVIEALSSIGKGLGLALFEILQTLVYILLLVGSAGRKPFRGSPPPSTG